MSDSLQVIKIVETSNELYILLAAFGGAVVGGIFVFIATLMQTKVARLQIKAQVIHSNKLNILLNFQSKMVELQTLLPQLAFLVFDYKIAKVISQDDYGIKYNKYYKKLLDIKHSLPFLVNITDKKHLRLYNLLNKAIDVYTNINVNNTEEWETNTISFTNEVANLAVEIFNEERIKIEKEILE